MIIKDTESEGNKRCQEAFPIDRTRHHRPRNRRRPRSGARTVFRLIANDLGRREAVRSCNRTSLGIHARLMACPLRIEFPGAVYHVTSQLSYLGTRLIRERLVRALHHFRLTSVQVSALSPPKRVGQFRDGRHHWGESHPGRRPNHLEPVEQTDSPLAHRLLWLLARLHG